jgi:hypothetical protein
MPIASPSNRCSKSYSRRGDAVCTAGVADTAAMSTQFDHDNLDAYRIAVEPVQ